MEFEGLYICICMYVCIYCLSDFFSWIIVEPVFSCGREFHMLYIGKVPFHVMLLLTFVKHCCQWFKGMLFYFYIKIIIVQSPFLTCVLLVPSLSLIVLMALSNMWSSSYCSWIHVLKQWQIGNCGSICLGANYFPMMRLWTRCWALHILTICLAGLIIPDRVVECAFLYFVKISK